MRYEAFHPVMAPVCHRHGFATAVSETGPTMSCVVERACLGARPSGSPFHRHPRGPIEGTPPRRGGTLRLITLNVCFHPADLEIRMQAIAEILESADSDIVALQEMTDNIVDILASHISQEWQIFKQSAMNVEDLFVYETNYCTCLLVKKSLRVVESSSLRFSITAMGRGLQYVVLTFPDADPEGHGGPGSNARQLVVATSHLESPVPSRSGQETREHQLREGAFQGE